MKKNYIRTSQGYEEHSTCQSLKCIYDHPDMGLVKKQSVSTPTAELIAAEDWVEFIPPVPPPPGPQTEPSEWEKVQALNILNADKIVALDDESALVVKALFRTWKSYLDAQEAKKDDEPDVVIPAGERVYYDDRLFKTRQAHTPQADWHPDVVPALFTEISLDDGSHDHPIKYNNNMELFKDLFYIQDAVLYQCIQSTGQPVYHPLSQLIGLYVKVSNE